MRIRPLLIIGGAVIWYLVSPLVLNKTVDEAFSFEPPSQTEIAQMSETELKEMEAEFLAAIPEEEELAQMPEKEREALEAKVIEVAEVMPEKMMEATTLTCPSPPRRLPTSAEAKEKIMSVTLPVFMISAMNTKSGTAMRTKL